MTSQSRNLIVCANFLVAVGVGIWSLYLVSMPLHPLPGDSHSGLLGVFSGLLLPPVAFMAFAAGRLVQLRSRFAWLTQLIALTLVVALVLLLAL